MRCLQWELCVPSVDDSGGIRNDLEIHIKCYHQAISIVSQFSDTETAELSGLMSPVHKARGDPCTSQTFPMPVFKLLSEFLSSCFTLTFVFYPLFL